MMGSLEIFSRLFQLTLIQEQLDELQKRYIQVRMNTDSFSIKLPALVFKLNFPPCQYQNEIRKFNQVPTQN